MFAFIVSLQLLARCEEVGINLVGQHCSLPVLLHFGDRRPLVACMDGETGRNESQRTDCWERKKGKADGVTQMIDGRMLRRNTLSNRHGKK